MSSSNFGLMVSLGALGLYGYSTYFMNTLYLKRGFADIVPPHLHVYGHYKFLTYQCLLIQLANALLHVLAHFIKSLRGPRDLVFSTLAFPIGSIVVYTFWLVWFVAGREAILPAKLDPFYPLWLNHSSHTVIVPINMIMAYLVHHKYSRKGVLLTLGYTSLYVAFLHVIKVQTGLFVYGYLNDMNDYQRLIYFACSAVFAYLMYKSGQLLTRAFHGGYASAPQQQQRLSPKKQKQK